MSLEMLATPAVIAVIVAALRQFTDKLDGPKAYWVSLVLNIAGQVAIALATGNGGELVAAAGAGVAGGAIVTPGLVNTSKRVGLGGVMKPRRDTSP